MRIFLIFVFLTISLSGQALAEKPRYALNLYAAQLTANHFEDFFNDEVLDFKNSYLLTVSLAKTIGAWKEKLNYEIEGQVTKHFKRQDHWEFNLLGAVRWRAFPWNRWLPTSMAFGIGPSWATEKPEIEVENDGETAHLLVYWMLELAIAPFAERPELELISRIHHRSDAFGLVADDGGSNALAIGLKYRF